MALKISFGALTARHEIHAQPVAALAPGGESLVLDYDPAIPSGRWMNAGPAAALQLHMILYRWALSYGDVVLNWQDFDR